MVELEWKPQLFTNPRKGKKMFDALVRMLESQQSQLETLADERNRLDDRIRVQYERWISDVRSLERQIDQMRRQMKSCELACLFEASKTNLVQGLKKKQDLVYKLKLGHLEDELADFIEWFDILSHRCPTTEDVSLKELHDIVRERSDNSSSKASSANELACRAMEKELKRLKCEFEKLSIKYSAEVSELQSGKQFVWNQYKEMESKYTTELEAQNDIVDQANDRVAKLLECMERLQSLNEEKDSEIADLKANLSKLESDGSEKDREISRLLEELESLKESKSDSRTPALRRCSARSKPKSLGPPDKSIATRKRSSSQGGKTEKRERVTNEEETPRLFTSQGSKSEKRRKKIANEEETPKLFSPDFKIPKLKSSSLR